MLDGSPIQMGVSCDDKVEGDHMTEGEYETVCKYIPGKEDSRFPHEVLQYLLDANAGAKREDNGNAEGSSANSLAWWQEPGDTCAVEWEQQTLDPILLALNSKVSIK